MEAAASWRCAAHQDSLAKINGRLQPSEAPLHSVSTAGLLLARLVSGIDLLPRLLQNRLHFAGIGARRRQVKILLVRLGTPFRQNNPLRLRIDRGLLKQAPVP